MPNESSDAPELLRQFMTYIETVRGKSPKTADEYYLDLRVFFRFLKLYRGLVPQDANFDDISIADVDIALIAGVTLGDVYEYMRFLARIRPSHPLDKDKGVGIGTAARARKAASLRSFYKYLTVTTHTLEENPVANLEPPKIKKALPKYLTLQESLSLLSSVSGPTEERDLCILTLFLNCGIRVSELTAINVGDIKGEVMKVTGKGNKERAIYLNEACKQALENWIEARSKIENLQDRALFVTRLHKRISPTTVKWLVKKYLRAAGLSDEKYSAHKLRHTAATLMYQNGVDVRVLQEVLGHENLDTTKIYTHVDNAAVREAFCKNPLASIGAKKRN